MRLRHYLKSQTEPLFRALGGDPKKRYIFIDNGARVCVTAHLDVSAAVPANALNIYFEDERYILSSALDDRLGVYIAMEKLPACGIVTDVLLTLDEERGQSTARKFLADVAPAISSRWNWIAAFDRAGSDAVTYDLDSEYFLEALNWCKFTIGRGTYSDPVEFEPLGICAVNVGVGYHSQHSIGCWCDKKELRANFSKFVRFFRSYESQRFVSTPKPVFSYPLFDTEYGYGYGYGYGDGYDRILQLQHQLKLNNGGTLAASDQNRESVSPGNGNIIRGIRCRESRETPNPHRIGAPAGDIGSRDDSFTQNSPGGKTGEKSKPLTTGATRNEKSLPNTDCARSRPPHPRTHSPRHRKSRTG